MLENAFGTFALTLNQFSDADQKDYAYRKLKDKCDPATFEIVLAKMYENIAMLSGFDAGVPLQAYMMTEIFCVNPEELLSEKIITTTDIYRNFIEVKFNYFYDRLGAENNYSMLQLRENYKKMRLKLYEIAALQACLDRNDFSELKLDCNELLDDINHGRDNLGLIVKVNDVGNAVFAHKTYAEFLAASWLSRNMEHAQMLFKKNLSMVRLMFDVILAGNSLAHLAVLYKNPQLLHKCSNLTCEDAGGRNPLHIAASWGVTYKLIEPQSKASLLEIALGVSPAKEDPRYLEILECLLQHNNPFAVDSIHQWDAIDYADRSLSLSALEIISQNSNFHPNKLKNCNELTICYYSIKLNHESLFSRIETVPYVVFVNRQNLLFTAVENNALSFMPKLLKTYNVNDEDLLFKTPLFLAAERGYHDMVLLLLDNGAKFRNITNPPLCGRICNVSICEELIKRGASVNECDGRLISPLMQAVLSKSPKEVVQLLLQHEADVNYATEGVTVLHHAAESPAASEVIELLIAHGADANKQNKIRGSTPLLHALKYNNLAVAKSLIKHSNLDLHDDMGFCALGLATFQKNEEIVKLLLENGAKTNCDQDQIPALHLAVFNDMKDSVEELLKAGAEVNCSSSEDLTALCLVKSVDVLELLLSHGVDVNFQNKKEHRTALHYAFSSGNLDVAKTLIKYMAQHSSDDLSIDGSVKKNEVLMLFDAACHSLECLLLLLDHGIDINVQDSHGFTALHFASAKGEGLKNLQSASSTIDPNILNKNGFSPLLLATLLGFPNIVQELIHMGAEVNGLKNNPLHIACLNGDVVLVLILLRANSNPNAYSDNVTPIFSTGLDQVDYHSTIQFETIKTRINQRQLAQMRLDCNKEDCLKELIAYGGDVNATMENSKATALHLFASKKLVKMMEIILDAGAEVDVKDCYGQTPLHMACIAGCETGVLLLLNHNGRTNVIDDFGKTPLVWASEKGHVAIIKLLLSSVKYHQPDLETFTTPLLASCLSSIEAVQLLLENKADVNMPGNVEKPISYDFHKFEIEEPIVKYPRAVNLQCEKLKEAIERWSMPLYTITPLNLALVLANTELVKLLLKFGANPNYIEANGYSSFDFVLDPLIIERVRDRNEYFSSCYDTVEELLKYNASSQKWTEYSGLLIIVAASRNKKMFQLLINNGADLDQLYTLVDDEK